MKKVLLISACMLLVFACRHNSSLSELAIRQLPSSLDEAMREQMGTVDTPEIKDVKVIYDCDSLCVVQCRAGAKDAYGMIRSETVRYFFVLDTYLSYATGIPSYGDLVVGGKYLEDRKSIKTFQKEMTERPKEVYMYYLSASRPVNL